MNGRLQKIYTPYLDSKLALRTHHVITNAQCLLKESRMNWTCMRNNTTRHKDLLVEFLEISGEGIWKKNEISSYHSSHHLKKKKKKYMIEKVNTIWLIPLLGHLLNYFKMAFIQLSWEIKNKNKNYFSIEHF